jgi:hypothetical protein
MLLPRARQTKRFLRKNGEFFLRLLVTTSVRLACYAVGPLCGRSAWVCSACDYQSNAVCESGCVCVRVCRCLRSAPAPPTGEIAKIVAAPPAGWQPTEISQKSLCSRFFAASFSFHDFLYWLVRVLLERAGLGVPRSGRPQPPSAASAGGLPPFVTGHGARQPRPPICGRHGLNRIY